MSYTKKYDSASHDTLLVVTRVYGTSVDLIRLDQGPLQYPNPVRNFKVKRARICPQTARVYLASVGASPSLDFPFVGNYNRTADDQIRTLRTADDKKRPQRRGIRIFNLNVDGLIRLQKWGLMDSNARIENNTFTLNCSVPPVCGSHILSQSYTYLDAKLRRSPPYPVSRCC